MPAREVRVAFGVLQPRQNVVEERSGWYRCPRQPVKDEEKAAKTAKLPHLDQAGLVAWPFKSLLSLRIFSASSRPIIVVRSVPNLQTGRPRLYHPHYLIHRRGSTGINVSLNV